MHWVEVGGKGRARESRHSLFWCFFQALRLQGGENETGVVGGNGAGIGRELWGNGAGIREWGGRGAEWGGNAERMRGEQGGNKAMGTEWGGNGEGIGGNGGGIGRELG